MIVNKFTLDIISRVHVSTSHDATFLSLVVWWSLFCDRSLQNKNKCIDSEAWSSSHKCHMFFRLRLLLKATTLYKFRLQSIGHSPRFKHN